MALTLLSVQEAAERYHTSLEQLHEMVDDGRITPVAVNGHVLLDDEEVRKVVGGNGSGLHWISLHEAAQRFSLSEELLERLAKDGVIRSGVLGDELHLAQEDIEPLAATLSKATLQHLDGVPISVSQAAEKYGFPVSSVFDWAVKGHIKILRRERKPVLLDEADVAYARMLADIRGTVKGRALFPSSKQYRDGLPAWLHG